MTIDEKLQDNYNKIRRNNFFLCMPEISTDKDLIENTYRI
jgi:hypothetical protein